MRVFCGVQATGRGHLSRFAVVKEIIERNGGDVFGYATGRELPAYATGINRFDRGPSFFIRNNRIDLTASARHNASLVFRFRKTVKDVSALMEGGDFDDVIVDFEPVTARAARRIQKPFTIFDNQTLALMDLPYPKHLASTVQFMRTFVRLYYGSLRGARRILTYSLLPLEPQLAGQRVIPPCVRKQVLGLSPTRGGHILFYASIGELPPGLMEFARRNPKAEVRAYFAGASKLTDLPPNIVVPHRDGENFLEDFASCRVYVSNAGFESVAEAVALRKPVVTVPIKGQAEQQMNAFLFEKYGIGISATEFSCETFERAMHHDTPPAEDIRTWVARGRECLERELRGGVRG